MAVSKMLIQLKGTRLGPTFILVVGFSVVFTSHLVTVTSVLVNHQSLALDNIEPCVTHNKKISGHVRLFV
jgi:hypothetical protein